MTHQTVCAYCGLDLFGDYHRWLLLQVDHVVPAGVARGLEIPAKFYEDAINLVLACAGCNGFDNRYTYTVSLPREWSAENFADLRDIVFAERAKRIDIRRAQELAVFELAPWSRDVDDPQLSDHRLPEATTVLDITELENSPARVEVERSGHPAHGQLEHL